MLLVYPIWIDGDDEAWPPWTALQRMLPPLGVLSIAAVLERAGFDVHVIDLHAEQISPDEFRRLLRKLRPRFVGITVLSAHVTCAHHVAKLCKDEIADVQVVVGGVHAESCPEQMLWNPHIDAVGRGDGEEVMLALVEGASPSEVAGLSFRGAHGVVHNPVGPGRSLDDYPFPAYHLVDFRNYFPPPGSYRELPAMNVLMTRGCPGKCTFCNSAATTLRSRSPARMLDLVELLHRDHGIRQFYFYDDTFTASPRAVRELCEGMLARRLDVKWICYVRGDMFRDDLARLMARAGCHQVLMGIESGSETLMREIGKPIDKRRYAEAVRTAHRHGMEVRGSFIIGHREETRATLEETLRFAKEIDLDLFQLSIMTPYPGTALFEQAKANGWLLHENFARYGQNEVVLRPAHLEPREITAFARRAYAEFYLRPRTVLRRLRSLGNLAQARDLIDTFGTLFLSSGTRNRARRTRAWLDFDLATVAPVRTTTQVEPRLTYLAREP